MRIRHPLIYILFLALTKPCCMHAQEDNYILKRQFFKAAPTTINISPDGLFLLAGFNDGSYSLLDPENFEAYLEVPDAHYRAVNAIDMPPAMDFIMTAGHSSLKLWNLDGSHLADWNGHATTIWNAEISKDGRIAVSSAMNKTFLLWDVSHSVLLDKMQGHTDVCMAVSISPDSRLVASAGNDLRILLWDLESRQILTELHGPTNAVLDLEFSPDGSLLAATSSDNTARIYNLKERELLHILKGHRDMVLEAEFSPDGNYLLTSSSDYSIILWDIRSGEQIYQFLENEAAVSDLVFHPDGRSFYSTGYKGALTHWRLDPEIFVLKYFGEAYLLEMDSDPLFEERRKGESKKDYLARVEEARLRKNEIIDRYYRKYLSGRAK